MGREDQGLYYLGRYCYARELRNGQYSLYEGAWSDRGEDNTAGLSVVRDKEGRPKRFKSWESVNEYFRDWKG